MHANGARTWLAGLGVVVVGVAGCGGEAADTPGDPGAQFVRLEDAGAASGAAAQAPSESASPATRAAEPGPDASPTAAEAPATASSAPRPGEPDQAGAPPLGVGREIERERDAAGALESGNHAVAARLYSGLLLDGVRSDVATREQLRAWSAALDRAQAGHRWSRRGAWPSLEITVQAGDSLIAIRARVLKSNPGLLLSTGLIARANQLASETAIRPGDVLRIPTDRPSILVDISARWALYLLGDEVAASWEVGVGKDATPTRPGRYTVGLKQKEPMWSPVGREPVPFGDPENPLGTRWLAWFEEGRNTSLGFHGTNDASGVGQRVSDGCVRMRNPDVELLFEILPKDASVTVDP